MHTRQLIAIVAGAAVDTVTMCAVSAAIAVPLHMAWNAIGMAPVSWWQASCGVAIASSWALIQRRCR